MENINSLPTIPNCALKRKTLVIKYDTISKNCTLFDICLFICAFHFNFFTAAATSALIMLISVKDIWKMIEHETDENCYYYTTNYKEISILRIQDSFRWLVSYFQLAMQCCFYLKRNESQNTQQSFPWDFCTLHCENHREI